MKASAIYQAQNRSIHKACCILDMPYDENKPFYLGMINLLINRDVTGLSDMTLGERDRFLLKLKRGGAAVYRPFIGREIESWKKGAPDIDMNMSRPMKVGKDKAPMVRKIHAILADMKLPWSYVDAIAKEKFNMEFVEWCEKPELYKIVQMMVIHQKRKRGYVY